MPSLTDFLKSVAYFDVLGAEDAERVAREVTEFSVARDGILFLEGEECRGLYVVKSGRVRIFKSSPEGREQVLLIAGPGDSFNDVTVFDDGPNPASASALVASVVCLIPNGVLRSLIADCPAALGVIKVFAARLRHLTVVVEDLSFRSVIGRLSKLLLSLATAEGESSPMPRLTQDAMASIVGSVRDAIGRALRYIEKTGAIRMETATPEIDSEKCTGCGDCVDVCPTGAVGLVDDKLVLVNPETCNYCTECEGVCPSAAIRCPFLIVLV